MSDLDVLDVPQVASLLGIGRNTVYDLVGRNALPHRRLGKQIRFSRTALVRWLDSSPPPTKRVLRNDFHARSLDRSFPTHATSL